MIIQQKTPERHEQQKTRLTGSRIGAILGLNPWRKPDDVLREMVREHRGAESEFIDNPAVQWGRDNEARAQLAFMRETGLYVEQCGFFPYGDRMGARPYGLTSDGGVLELKVPFSLRNGGEFKSLSEQPHYAAQAQMEMLATGRAHAYFAQYIAPKGDPLSVDYVPEQVKIERIKHDPQWIDKVMPELDLFYRRLMAELDNPEHLEPLRVRIDTPETELILSEVDRLRALKKESDAQEKELLARLIELAGEKNAEVHGRKLTLAKGGNSINYAKAIAELAPDADLSKWTTQRKDSWRLT
jgi:putative phage-type endonuclease